MDGMTFLVLLGLAWALGYLAACAWWPFMACSAGCQGGKVRSPSGRAYRRCRRCKGRGSKVRLGRRVFDALRGRRGADV